MELEFEIIEEVEVSSDSSSSISFGGCDSPTVGN